MIHKLQYGIPVLFKDHENAEKTKSAWDYVKKDGHLSTSHHLLLYQRHLVSRIPENRAALNTIQIISTYSRMLWGRCTGLSLFSVSLWICL
jgi:hypothetical protein